MSDRFASVEEYIASKPERVQALLREIRAAVSQAVPDTGEKIAYGIPTVTISGQNLLSYAAWAKHIGVYPIPAGDAEFQSRIAPLRDAKSTVRLPLAEPIPVDLIAAMARFRAQEIAP